MRSDLFQIPFAVLFMQGGPIPNRLWNNITQPTRPTTSQLHSAISPRDTAECFETSSALALPSLFGTAKAVVKPFIGWAYVPLCLYTCPKKPIDG